MTTGLFIFKASLTAWFISETFLTLKPLAPYSSATLSKGGLLISAPKYLFP